MILSQIPWIESLIMKKRVFIVGYWTRREFECFFKVSLLPRGSSAPEVAIREVFTRIESVFAPRAALFMRTESIRHPQTSIEIESCWYQNVFDSKASFAYLTEGKRNPSPLPSLHSHSNLTHLVTRIRINIYLSFQIAQWRERWNAPLGPSSFGKRPLIVVLVHLGLRLV